MNYLKISRYIILAFILALSYSCEDIYDLETEDSSENNEHFFEVDGVTYSEFHPFIQTLGKDSSGLFMHWLQFATKDVITEVGDNDVVGYDGEGYILTIGVYTDEWGGISKGTYTLGTTSQAELNTYEASYFNTGGGGFVKVESGDVSVNKNTKGYEIEFDLTDENGEAVAVKYKGEIDFHYDRESFFFDPKDDQLYDLVKIGDQVWFQRNYAFKADDNCWEMDKEEATVEKYGYLYTWEKAVELAPEGFRLPTHDDFLDLNRYAANIYGNDVGKELVVGGELNFNAYQYGYRKGDGTFEHQNTRFWTSTEETATEVRFYGIGIIDTFGGFKNYPYETYFYQNVKESALSVRYIKE